MTSDDLISLPGVLALECTPGDSPARSLLERDEAEILAALIGGDLDRLLPGASGTRLAVTGALFDAAQLLRPQFPVFTTMEELAARLPRENGDIIAFGARDGRMPAQTLTPDSQLQGSPMLYLPWTLLAPTDENGRALGEAMEVELIGRGEAGARCADMLMRTLGMQLQHARYLSRHDLMALTCVQYEHANLAPLWTLLETALLAPEATETGISARGLPLCYEDALVHAASPLTQLRAAPHESPEAAAHTLAGWVFELRQYAAILAAHQLPLHFDHATDASASHILEHLVDPDPDLPAPALYTHPAPGLGTIAVTIAQPDGTHMHNLAHAIVLDGRPSALCAQLAERYGATGQARELERIHLDAEYRLCIPPANAVH